MIQKIKGYIIYSASIMALIAPAVVPTAIAYAATTPSSCNTIQQNISTGLNDAVTGGTPSSCTTSSNGTITNGISSIASQAVNDFSIVVGVIAVIMIIYGGFKYITSSGDSNKVSTAKNTLIYAIVGLVIVALAQLIVHYVLNTASTVS